jgi:hypothetical protein
MHQRMQHVLMRLIAHELALMPQGEPRLQIPKDLVARHVAATFVLVLNWWIESDSALAPAEVDAYFREMVLPSLNGVCAHDRER